MKVKSPLVNPLRKFWKKKLAHIKKPMKRKRKMVDQYVFATMSKQRKNGIPSIT